MFGEKKTNLFLFFPKEEKKEGSKENSTIGAIMCACSRRGDFFLDCDPPTLVVTEMGNCSHEMCIGDTVLEGEKKK